MIPETFQSFPDSARLWVYGFERPLGRNDRRLIDDRLAGFMKHWHSHHVGVQGAYAVLHDRFVLLCGASTNGISGCSIDSSVEHFKFFRDQHGLDALNRDLVHYRLADGTIGAVERQAFQAEVVNGRCGPQTAVFDLTIGTLGDLRRGRFEVPMAEAWHGRAFLPV
jgi:hypothetical protein